MRKRVRYIYLAFAISFVITIIISILYLEQFSALQKSNEELEKSYQVKNKILKVQAYLIEAESSQREYLITEDKKLLRHLFDTETGVYKEMANLKELTTEPAGQQKIIARLKEIVSSYFRILYETTDAENSSNLLVFLQNREKGNRSMNDFLVLSNRMETVESNLLLERKHRNDWLQFITSFYLKLILFLSILFQLVSFIIITRAFKRRKTYQKILENKIKELNLSNSEMEQIAFVASHDLQEPLRKIRTFSDKLIKHNSSGLNNEGQKLVEKIALSGGRMQELLHDFINYTHIVQSTEKAGIVSLEKVIEDVCKEFKETIEDKKAILNVNKLPQLIGYSYQLHLLFSSLLDNALKFSKSTMAPVINITVADTEESDTRGERKYIKISFSDNGIGFEKEFAEKIFIIFQRLHSQNSSYSGKGIGLAICKRVMVNHDGYITARGEAGVGAKFDLYFLKEGRIMNE